MDTNPERWQELVEEALTGNRGAFSEIVRIMMKPIIALTYRMTQNHDAAYDLAQETFLSAWDHRSEFRGESGFNSWLYKIATNKTLNYLASRQRTSFPADDYLSEMASETDNPENVLVKKELRENILRFMTTLPDQQRIVFDLRFYKDMPFAEIARITGKAEGTVKTNYREAVKKLKEFARTKRWGQ
ncbi:MAG: RNA polymerase sigma factor [Candidatus Zixiibacteriota bacterium]